MRYGVLADVHANLPALEAALEAVRRRGVDRWVVAGDLVGYGAQPNECVAAVAGLEQPLCVAGNHDLIAVGELAGDRCIRLARESLEWTRATLSAAAREWLGSLPRRLEQDSLVVAHGSLDDPEAYTADGARAAAQLAAIERAGADLLVLGHTHRPLVAAPDAAVHAPRGTVELAGDGPWLVNPGAVGQSRELRIRARAAVVDTDARSAEFVAVPYDVAAAREALRRVGLSERGLHLPPSALGGARRTARRALAAARRAAA